RGCAGRVALGFGPGRGRVRATGGRRGDRRGAASQRSRVRVAARRRRSSRDDEERGMRLEGKHVVVTGGASGIGAALAQRFSAEGARAVVVADVQDEALARVASSVHGLAVHCDVTREEEIVALIDTAQEQFGDIDLFCSNAGIVVPGGPEASNAAWERSIGVNVLAHVYAARALVPRMLERGEGYLLQTASAAGLLTQIGSAPYSV